MSGTIKGVSLILIAVVLMAYANVAAKLRAAAVGGSGSVSWLSYIMSMLRDPWSWSVGIAALVAGLLYIIALRELQLGVAQPLFALVFVVVPLAAALVLGEPLPPLRIAGLVLIFAGVILVEQTS
jgi:drug/metabolite transporter (DMT)-like permease